MRTTVTDHEGRYDQLGDVRAPVRQWSCLGFRGKGELMIRRVVALSAAGVLAVTLGLTVSAQPASRSTSDYLQVEVGEQQARIEVLRPRGTAGDGDENGSARPARFGNRGAAGPSGAALPQ